jgi:hypothetical protein
MPSCQSRRHRRQTAVAAVLAAAAAVLGPSLVASAGLAPLIAGVRTCFAQAGRTVVFDGTFGGNKAVFTLRWQPDGKKLAGSYYLAATPGKKVRLAGEQFSPDKLSLTEFSEGQNATSTIWLTKTVVNGKGRWTGRSFTTGGKKTDVVMEERRGGKP